jgi:hypothetical protein
MRQATLYIGLNDAKTHEQKFETEKYVRLLKNICREYHVAVSVSRVSGSYFHEDGTYVEEETLVLMIMGAPDETIREIAGDVCVFFNQESIMVSYAECETHFLKERFEIHE